MCLPFSGQAGQSGDLSEAFVLCLAVRGLVLSPRLDVVGL